MTHSGERAESALFDNPDLDQLETDEVMTAAIEAASGRGDVGARLALVEHRQRLEGAPWMLGVWRLMSRSMGRRHRFDTALASVKVMDMPQPRALDADAASRHLAQNLHEPPQRDAILESLIELPEVPQEALFMNGFLYNQSDKE